MDLSLDMRVYLESLSSSSKKHLTSTKQPTLGGTLHGVDVVLICVASRKVEVGDVSALVRPELVHPWRLPIQGLLKLHNI